MEGKEHSVLMIRELIEGARKQADECKDENKQIAVLSLRKAIVVAEKIIEIIDEETDSHVVNDFQMLMATCVSLMLTRPDLIYGINLSILMALSEMKLGLVKDTRDTDESINGTGEELVKTIH